MSKRRCEIGCGEAGKELFYPFCWNPDLYERGYTDVVVIKKSELDYFREDRRWNWTRRLERSSVRGIDIEWGERVKSGNPLSLVVAGIHERHLRIKILHQ